MSYGKDQSQLNNLGTYGASTQQMMGNATRRAPQTSKGEASWMNNYKPSTHAPDNIRLIPGSFETFRVNEAGDVYSETIPWLEAVEHFHGGLKKSSICSAGPRRMSRQGREPCDGCDIYWEDFQLRKDKERETGVRPKTPNRVSLRNLFVFLTLDKGYFFETEELDKNTGQVRVNPSTGKPYMRWMKYTGPHQNAALQGKNARYGMVQAFPMGRDYFNVLQTYSDLIGSTCGGCGAPNSIQVWKWVCRTCQADILDPAQAGLNLDQIKEITRKPNTCRSCGTTAYPMEALACGSCRNPRRTSIFDVDLYPMQGKDSQTSRSQLIITGYSAPSAIEPQFLELLKSAPDLTKKYAPTPLAEQHALFQVASSYSSPQQQAAPPPQQPQVYGQPAQQPQYQDPQQAAAQYPPQQPQYAQPYPPQHQAPQYQQPQQPQYQQPAPAQPYQAQPQQQPQPVYPAPQVAGPQYPPRGGSYGQ